VLLAVLAVLEGKSGALEVEESMWPMSLEHLVVLVEREEDVGCIGAHHIQVDGEGAVG
jgi:hypothetical protein